MRVGDISEFELIATLESAIAERNSRQIERLRESGIEVELGIGDDAAAWQYPASIVVATTDTMVEGVHFRRDTTPWRGLGWKAAASNLSDVGAMGCSPTFALVTLGLSPDITVGGLCEMYQGMMDSLEYTGGALIGGDIVRSGTFFVTVALDGVAEDGATVLTRSAARVGDAIGVTGTLGSSAGGLKLLERDASPTESRFGQLIAAHNRPTPRVAEGISLRKLGVRCAMDVSDGLTADLGKICESSRVSAHIEADSVPVDVDLKLAFPDEWLGLALSGGEDYELVFTADDATMGKVQHELDTPVTVIGRIGDGKPGVTLVDRHGGNVEVERGGWDHFAK